MVKSNISSSDQTIANFQQSFQFNETLHRLVLGSAWQTTSAVISRIVPALLVIILALFLKPAQLGVYSFIIASYTVLSLVADLGIAYSLQKFIQENPKDASKIASTSLVLRLVSSLALSTVCWFADWNWGILKGYSLYVGLLLVSSAFGTVTFVLNARFKYKKASLLTILRVSCWLILSIILVAIGQPIAGPIYSLAIAFLFVGILTIFLESSYFHLGFDWHLAQRIVRFGVLITIASAFSVLTTQVGILALAYLTNEHEVGIYKLALTFGMVPMLLGEGVILPLLPLIKKSLVENSEETPKLIRLVVRYLLIFGLFFMGAGFVLARPIINMVFGATYLTAIWPLRYLLAASLLGLLYTVLLSISFMSSDLKIATKISATVAGLSLVGSLILIPLRGTRGAAISLFFSYAIGLILIGIWLHRRLQVSIEWRKYGIFILSLAEMMFILLLFINSMTTPSLRLIVGIILAPGLYFTALLIQKGITLEEISRMIKIVKAKY